MHVRGQPFPLNTFSDCLRAARAARGLSVRELEKASGVSFSLISALENGRRSAGPKTIRKLVRAFRLRGAERQRFLDLGGDTSGRHRVRVDEKRKGMLLLGALISALAGVDRADIEDIIIVHHSRPGTVHDFVIRMRDCTMLAGEIKRGEIRITPFDSTGAVPVLAPSARRSGSRVILIPPKE